MHQDDGQMRGPNHSKKRRGLPQHRSNCNKAHAQACAPPARMLPLLARYVSIVPCLRGNVWLLGVQGRRGGGGGGGGVEWGQGWLDLCYGPPP